jgi:hypothetical protein
MSRITIVKMNDFGRVFYVECSPEKKSFQILEKFLDTTFVREKDLMLEDAGHPMTPPNIRFIAASKKIAEVLEKFIQQNPDHFGYVQRNDSDTWFIGNPDVHTARW